MAFADRIPRLPTYIISCATVCLSFISFAAILIIYTYTGMLPHSDTLYTWIPIEQLHTDISLRIDPLSLLMALIVTGIGFLIHVYSIGYIEHEEDFARYFACLNFFIFAMLLLVLADNLLLLFVGWEGVGLASYLLIGYWYFRPAAARAATKAFVVNRIGDFGLLLGLLLAFHLFGTTHIATISEMASQQYDKGDTLLTIMTLLFFVGAIGKSAQLPLHVWLPDAMEGPTPVSALIHAATMVNAGVYLIVRLHPVFMMTPQTLQLVGVVGAATALYAALSAVGQTDLKRVLAYSTVSQLGLMFLACGSGAFYSAMFHLTTHAFVKALLFLSAGNVVHMMQGTTELNKMGGLSKNFPYTHWLFFIGVLALSGVPPLATFFSKDLILEQEYLAGFEVLFYIGLAASILTAFYLTRVYCLTFFGTAKLPPQILSQIKEAPRIMLLPVFILGTLAIIGGFLGFTFGKTPLLEGFLKEVGVTLAEKKLSSGFILTPETWYAVGGAFFGIITAGILYLRFADRLGAPLSILKHSFYVDQLYELIIVTPLKSLARLITNFFEMGIFDGCIRLVTANVNRTASLLITMQSGQIRSYAAWIVIGVVVLMIYLVF
jgi:NADH-quinone oxidoreductase subunit L